MFSYRAYNLGIRSAFPLPELLPDERPVDVVIRLGDVEPRSSEARAKGSEFKVTPEGDYLLSDDVATLLIKGGREIIVNPVPGADEHTLRVTIVGPGLATLLHQRGYLLLHATTVARGEAGIALVGTSGQGKSTLAMGLHAQAYAVMTDDLTAITIDDSGRAMVFPGVPRLKLWPDSVISLGDNPERFPLVIPDLEKRACPATSGFPETSVALEHIYVLAEGNAHKIEPMTPQEAFVELVSHTYYGWMFHSCSPSSYALQYARIVNAVPISRLTIRKSFEALPEVIRMVEEDLV